MIYVWAIPRAHAVQMLMDSFYATWVNLSIRTLHEADKVRPVIEKVEQALALGQVRVQS